MVSSCYMGIMLAARLDSTDFDLENMIIQNLTAQFRTSFYIIILSSYMLKCHGTSLEVELLPDELLTNLPAILCELRVCSPFLDLTGIRREVRILQVNSVLLD